MNTLTTILTILTVACAAEAQVWPAGARCGSETGQPCSPVGLVSFHMAGAMLRSEHWNDTRSRFSAELGLGRGVGLSVGSSGRSLRGYGAYVQGIEDARMGMSLWPEFASKFAMGVNGFLTIPTGYRKQESYYDPEAEEYQLLPAMSLKQTAGEIYSGAVWKIAPAADMNLFGGYFCTSDRAEQAFRWGVGTRLAPFGQRCWAELNFSQSIPRSGLLPGTQTFEAALPVRTGFGLVAAPGLWADLDEEPLYGLSLGLRFTSPVSGMGGGRPARVAPTLPRIAGVILVAPPLSDVAVADGRELWQSIQDGVRESFDAIKPLATLDLPGLPFDARAAEPPLSTIRAIAMAHSEADWLLISRVIREDVSKQAGVAIPLVVRRGEWAAQCKVKVQLIDLRGERLSSSGIIEGRAAKRDNPQLAALSSSSDGILTTNSSRELTFEAYRSAGREIARELLSGR